MTIGDCDNMVGFTLAGPVVAGTLLGVMLAKIDWWLRDETLKLFVT